MQQNEDTLSGLLLGLLVYFLWGFLPIYMKALAHITPLEIVAHRVIWSVPIAGIVLYLMRRTQDLQAALQSPRTLWMAMLTAGLISLNWGLYVWAITSGHALDAALGYYINPLFSIFLGSVLLKEPLNRLQKTAIGLAAIAVAILIFDSGKLPVAALGLTLSWGFYAYFKKSLPIGPNQGFMLEVLILLPFALGIWLWLTLSGQSHFAQDQMVDTALLLGCGLVTAVPLLIYANAAKRLRLSTIGIMQYIAPTMIFLTAIFIFNEPFTGARLVAFPLIWCALLLYTVAMLMSHRRVRIMSKA